MTMNDTPPGEQTVAGGAAPTPMYDTTDSAEAYLQQMREERGYLLDFHRVMAENDFAFLKGYNSLLEAAYTAPRLLDSKVKEFLFVALLCAVRSTPDHIRTHMQVAKEKGASREEMLEVLELMLPPCGVPTFMLGLDVWRQVFDVE